MEIEKVSHLPRLVVPAQHDDLFRVQELGSEEVSDDLDGEGAAIDVVAQEEVLAGVDTAAYLYQGPQVVELPVDVPDDGHRVLNLKTLGRSGNGIVGFQNRPASGPKIVDFGGLNGPARSAPPF